MRLYIYHEGDMILSDCYTKNHNLFNIAVAVFINTRSRKLSINKTQRQPTACFSK